MNYLFIVFYNIILFSTLASSQDQSAKPDLKANTVIEQKKWKAKPEYKISLSKLKNSYQLEIIKDSERQNLIAKTTFSLPVEKEFNTEISGLALDLAPYAISENQIAIGIRWSRHDYFPAGESDSKMLRLYVQTDKSLRQILELNMGTDSTQRGPNDDIQTKCILKIGKVKHFEYFDLSHSCKTRVTPLVNEDEVTNKNEKSEITEIKKNTLYIWDNAKKSYIKK